MFLLMDCKEHGRLKERTKAKEVKAEQELGIGSKTQESGSLCDAFPLFRDHAECFFLLFLFSSREKGKRRCVVIDRRIRVWFLFLIYTSVLTTSLASKNEEKTLSVIHPSYYSVMNIFDHFEYPSHTIMHEGKGGGKVSGEIVEIAEG